MSVPGAGPYSSAVATASPPPTPDPARQTSTEPSGRSVAVCKRRAAAHVRDRQSMIRLKGRTVPRGRPSPPSRDGSTEPSVAVQCGRALPVDVAIDRQRSRARSRRSRTASSVSNRRLLVVATKGSASHRAAVWLGGVAPAVRVRASTAVADPAFPVCRVMQLERRRDGVASEVALDEDPSIGQQRGRWSGVFVTMLPVAVQVPLARVDTAPPWRVRAARPPGLCHRARTSRCASHAGVDHARGRSPRPGAGVV